MTPDDKKYLQNILNVFKTEAKRHLKAVVDLTLKAEAGKADDEDMEALFRAVHSLKGSAATIGFEHFGAVAHELENLLGALKRKELPLEKSVVDVILKTADFCEAQLIELTIEDDVEETAADRIKSAITDIIQGESETSSKKKRRPNKTGINTKTEQKRIEQTSNRTDSLSHTDKDTTSITTDKLDALEADLGELTAAQKRDAENTKVLGDLNLRLGSIERELENAIRRYSEPDDFADLINDVRHNLDRIGYFRTALNKYEFDRYQSHSAFSLALVKIGGDIRRLRMYPIRELFESFTRAVRDLAAETEKEIEFVIEGEDNELDNRIIEKLRDPINHLLRNAIDHGIEAPDKRETAGKPRTGAITLKASRSGPNLAIDVSDDGRGLDKGAIIARAIERGQITTEKAETLTSEELYLILFRPGFTTTDAVTRVSGRGVGLDVVRENVNELGGTVQISSEPGSGTTFSILVPTTIATTRGLLVRSTDDLYLVPAVAVNWIDNIQSDDVFAVEGRRSFTYRDKTVPMISLETVLGTGNGTRSGDEYITLVLTGAQGYVGIVVEDVLGEREYIMQGLSEVVSRIPYYGGASIRENGEVTLVLDPEYIATAALAVRESAKPAERQKRSARKSGRIVIVDDSITTQTLEKNILESAGYEVLVAGDGVEGLDIMDREEVALAIIDIQMPRMDGLEMTRRLRAEEDTAALPIILVTSMDDDEYKRMGVEAGADAYISKQEFDQKLLLELIEQFL
ncbi:MAG: response regulator [bacterium]|nr:response regulator [bacterium]